MFIFIVIVFMAVLCCFCCWELFYFFIGFVDFLLVDESVGCILECEYQFYYDMDMDFDVIDVVNNCMCFLQCNCIIVCQVCEKFRANNWSYYKILYNEVFWQLFIEGMFVYNNLDVCGVLEKL